MSKKIPISKTIFFITAFLSFYYPTVSVAEMAPKPTSIKDAIWGASIWGVVEAVPKIVKDGSTIIVHGMVVGGPAADPYWSCTQWGWSPNGTFKIGVGVAINKDVLSDSESRDAGDPPPLGWENRISDTCYCSLSSWGASGNCDTREAYPTYFKRTTHELPELDYASGLKAVFTVVKPWSFNYWAQVTSQFIGEASVGNYDSAYDYVYVIGDLTALEEDTDEDGLPDVWEIAHDPTLGVGDPLSKFSGGDIAPSNITTKSVENIIENPYLPRSATWVSKGPNDWDGDGISNKDEYLKWYNNEVDGNGIPFDPTIINSKSSNNSFLPSVMMFLLQ